MGEEDEIQDFQEPFIEMGDTAKSENNKNVITETRLENEHVNLREWFKEFQNENLKKKFSWKYFAVALLLGLLPSLVGLVTNVVNATTFIRGNQYQVVQGNCSEHHFNDEDDDDDDEETKESGCFQKDTVFGAFTLVFIFLPGLNIYPLLVANISTTKTSATNVIVNILLCLICVLTFPAMLVIIKICCVFNHGQNMKSLNFLFVFSKCILDSSLQLCFQIFVMISRAERIPSLIQIVASVFSSVAVTKINTEQYLISRKDLHFIFGKSFKQKLILLVKFAPLFLFTTLFKCVSFSIIFAALGLYSVWLYLAVLLALFVTEIFTFTKQFDRFEVGQFFKHIFVSTQVNKSVFKGLMTHLFTLTNDGNPFFHMTFFLVLNTTILLLLTLLSNLGHTLQPPELNPLLNNLLHLNGLTASTIISGLLAYTLYIIQVYRGSRKSEM